MNNFHRPQTSVAILAGGSFSEFNVSLAIAKCAIDSLIDLPEYKLSLFILEQNFEVIECDPVSFLKGTDPASLFKKLKEAPFLYRDSTLARGSVSSLLASAIEDADIIFPLMQGPLGECGAIQGFIKIFNKPFASIDVLASAICKDKEIQKCILKANHLPTLPFKAFKNHERNEIEYGELKHAFGPGLILKPANLGSSVGVEFVENQDEFESALKSIFYMSNKVLIEPYLEHLEYECYVSGDEAIHVQQPIKKMRKGKFITFYDKYFSNERMGPMTTAEYSNAKIEEIKHLAAKAYRACQCDFFARVDVFVDRNEQVYINEINTVPALDTQKNTDLFLFLFNKAIQLHSKRQQFLNLERYI
jgi:D-alanine-D-alanine ligase